MFIEVTARSGKKIMVNLAHAAAIIPGEDGSGTHIIHMDGRTDSVTDSYDGLRVRMGVEASAGLAGGGLTVPVSSGIMIP